MSQNCATTASATSDFGLLNYVSPPSTISEDQIAANLDAYGPIPVLVCADAWQSYTSGVMTKAQCGTCAINHVVVLVGYTSNTWIIRNSWSSSWGVNGILFSQKLEHSLI
jgi:hypothetical protein